MVVMRERFRVRFRHSLTASSKAWYIAHPQRIVQGGYLRQQAGFHRPDRPSCFLAARRSATSRWNVRQAGRISRRAISAHCQRFDMQGLVILLNQGLLRETPFRCGINAVRLKQADVLFIRVVRQRRVRGLQG